MNWFSRFLTSSIGQKWLVAITGIFLILFLVVHLLGNLQLLYNDGGMHFNLYAKLMTTNPLIKTVSYILYLSILLHAFQGIFLWLKNRAARGSKGYAVKVTRAVNTNGTVSSNMAWLGIIIFIFLALHLWQFWLQMKLGNVNMVTYEGVEVKDLYTPVAIAFKMELYVIVYVISMFFLGVHLWHGFQSAFQTFGINHKKYSPLIRTLGKLYAILVSLGFALLPVYFYFFK